MNKRIMINIKQAAKAMPFVCLIVNCLSLVFYDSKWYDQNVYYLLSQITGHGFLLLVGYAFFAHYHRLCYYTLISIYGLISLNLLNICYYLFGGFPFYFYYSAAIMLISLCLSVIFIIKRK